MTTIPKRKFVIKQYEKKKTRSEILKIGKSLKLYAMFIKQTLHRYEETKSVNDCYRSGRPKSKRTIEVIKAVREKIQEILNHRWGKWPKSIKCRKRLCLDSVKMI